MELIEQYIYRHGMCAVGHDWIDFRNIDQASPAMQKRIEFARKRLSFAYDTERIMELVPFGPLFKGANGECSVTLDDLSSEECELVKDLICVTQDNYFLGKWQDVLGCLTNDDFYRVNAAHHLYLSFKECIQDGVNYYMTNTLIRCLYLWYLAKRKSDIDHVVSELLDSSIYKEKHDMLVVARAINTFAKRFHRKALKKIANEIEPIVECENEPWDLTLDLCKIIIDYYKSIHQDEDIKLWQERYVEMCRKIAKQRHPHGYDYYEKAIQILDTPGHENLINELHFELDEAQEALCDSFEMKAHPLPVSEEEEAEFNKQRQVMFDDFDKAPDGAVQLLLFLKHFAPNSKEQIEKEIEINQDALFRMFNNICFDADKHIAFESSKASEEEQREYDIARSYHLHSTIIAFLVLGPLTQTLRCDDALVDILREILAHNVLVPKDRLEIVLETFRRGLKNEIGVALYDLLSQFEYGCRHYLKVHKKIYPIERKGGREDLVDLNKILVQKGERENRFRKAMVELLGEDLTLEIEYLSCRPLSANLRNRNYHDGRRTGEGYTLDEMVLFFLLLKAYCLGCDPEL